MKELQIVLFTLKNRTCGALSSQVKQILGFKDVVNKQKMPKFLCGQIKWKKSDAPIICLNDRLGLGETAVSKKTKIIIAKVEEQLIGFVVDDVIEIFKTTEDSIVESPELIRETGEKFIRGFIQKGEKLISLIDFNLILAKDELKEIKEYSK